jgi:hypothetical protein
MPRLLLLPAKFRKIFIYTGLLAVFCSLFLLSPKPPDDYCGKYVVVGTGLGYPLNCDSYPYVETAKDPLKLFEKDSIRQSRPVYVMLAFGVGKLISPIFSLIPETNFTSQDELLRSPIYWGFMILNFLILLSSLLLFDRIIDILTENKFSQFLKYIFSIFLISNIVIKTSFWSAHQQMFTFFSPLLCLYLTLKIVLAKELSFKKLYLSSFLGGILLLAYGNFLLLLPMLLLAVLIQTIRTGRSLKTFILKLFFPIAFIFSLPLAIWYAVLLKINGSIYNHEVSAYRQFVWVYDKLSISFGDFFNQFVSFLSIYWISIYRTILIFLIVLVLLKVFNRFYPSKSKKEDLPPDYPLMKKWIAVIFVFYFLFFFFMGYYSERLTFTLVPIVLCLIILELNLVLARGRALTVNLVYVLLLILTLGWVFRGVTYPEPYKELSETSSATSFQTII